MVKEVGIAQRRCVEEMIGTMHHGENNGSKL
jgi:hypothetical protein